MEIKIGQEVYLKPTGNIARRNGNIREAQITKIGRKYFYVENEKFDIKTLENINEDCNSAWIIYSSMQEIQDEKEKYDLIGKFYYMFNRNVDCKRLSLQQLREMAKIAELK